jgi:hypothetical protein
LQEEVSENGNFTVTHKQSLSLTPFTKKRNGSKAR